MRIIITVHINKNIALLGVCLFLIFITFSLGLSNNLCVCACVCACMCVCARAQTCSYSNYAIISIATTHCACGRRAEEARPVTFARSARGVPGPYIQNSGNMIKHIHTLCEYIIKRSAIGFSHL